MAYTELISKINNARDNSDLDRLRDIASDADGYMVLNGLSGFNIENNSELCKLRNLLDSLQQHIISVIEKINELRACSGYTLYKLSLESCYSIEELAEHQADSILKEISGLKIKAREQADEIDRLTGNTTDDRIYVS